MVTDEVKPIAYLSITNTLAWLVGLAAAVGWMGSAIPTAEGRDAVMLPVACVFFGACLLALLVFSIQAIMGRPGLFVRDGRLIYGGIWSCGLKDIQIVRVEKLNWLTGSAIVVKQKNGRYRQFPLFFVRTTKHEILRSLAAVGAPVEGYWPAPEPAATDEGGEPR